MSKKLKKIVIRFPEDFKKSAHILISGAVQYKYPTEGPVIISIVGGGIGLYGDGVISFEMYDFREEEPQGYLTAEDINEHLESHPL